MTGFFIILSLLTDEHGLPVHLLGFPQNPPISFIVFLPKILIHPLLDLLKVIEIINNNLSCLLIYKTTQFFSFFLTLVLFSDIFLGIYPSPLDIWHRAVHSIIIIVSF